MNLLKGIGVLVLYFDGWILRAIFFRAVWRYLLSFQFMQSLYIQLHLPWTIEFRLPLKFGFRRPWTLPALLIDLLEQIFTNDPAGAPSTWVFDTVVIFNTAFVLYVAVLLVLHKLSSIYKSQEEGEEFEFPTVQAQLENPGGSRSWMQEEFVALEEIAIWERPVDHLRLFYPGGKPKGSGVFKHDYIVIKLACGESFTVEKEAEVGKYVKFTRGNGTQRGVTRRFSMELRGATVPVVELGHVLGKEGHGYDILRENCWFYAFNTTQSVIELCGKDLSLGKEKRASLLKDLQHMDFLGIHSGNNFLKQMPAPIFENMCVRCCILHLTKPALAVDSYLSSSTRSNPMSRMKWMQYFKAVGMEEARIGFFVTHYKG